MGLPERSRPACRRRARVAAPPARGPPARVATPPDRCGARPRARGLRACPRYRRAAPARGLPDGRLGIHLRHDEMHGGAVPLAAFLQRPRMGVQAFERGQPRRMDVDQPLASTASRTTASETRMKPARPDELQCRALQARPAARARRPRGPCRSFCDRPRMCGCPRLPRAPAPTPRDRSISPRTISAGKAVSFAASISATMLEPRPEIRTATRFLAAVFAMIRGGACRYRRRAA